MEQEIERIHFQSSSEGAAETYARKYNDSSAVSHLFKTRLIRVYEMLGKVDGMKVLDVGCGPGFISRYILENRGRYFGIDLSMAMLKQCQKTLGEEQSSPLSQATVANLPFLNAAFDGALCLGVLEYVEDLDSAVEELSRVLKDDAIVIMSMQNRFGLYRFWERHIHCGFLFNALRRLVGRPIVDKPIEKLTSLRKLKYILSRHHLIVIDALYYNFNIWLKPLDRLFPDLSVRTSRKLESLHLSMLGMLLGADFLIRVQNGISDLETVSKMIL